jgi:hypothetical protein
MAAMEVRVVKSSGRAKCQLQHVVDFEGMRVEFHFAPQLLDRLLNPAERQKQAHREVVVPQRVAWGDFDSAPKAVFCLPPLSGSGRLRLGSVGDLGVRPR